MKINDGFKPSSWTIQQRHCLSEQRRQVKKGRNDNLNF